MTDPTPDSDSRSRDRSAAMVVADAHLSFGWWALFVFLILGLGLEAMHAFKFGYYLDSSNETRRLMWRLAHAHGTLIALVHISFALSLPLLLQSPSLPPSLSLASRCLYGCGVLLPLGFFLGGIFVYGGDPGLAVLLAPVGALLGAVALFLIARARRGARS